MKRQSPFFQWTSLFSFLLIVLYSCSEDTEWAKFTFQENLALSYNSSVDIEAEVMKSGLQKVELSINDSVVTTWNNPGKEKLTYTLNSLTFGVGAKTITLTAYDTDGEIVKDERIFRILSDLKPEKWAYEIVESYPHNIENFTQGFEFSDNQLYESTGQYGQSRIAKVDFKTGKTQSEIGLDATHFGEGITILGDTIYQLTWTTKKCFLYDKNTLQILPKDFTYQGEGWGICNDGTSLITSDGSERLCFRDPATFRIIKTIEVYTDEQPVIRLNELEYMNGLILANVWMTNNIVVIEPETGRVLAVIDGGNLVTLGRGKTGEVLNGIAYNKEEGMLYVTGKNWEKTFKIKLSTNTPNTIAKK